MTFSQPFLFSGATLQPNWPFGNLEPGSYGLIMADPPWSFQLYSDKGDEKSPQAQYACMSADQIKAMPVGSLASPNCMLWLWATWPLLPLAVDVIKAWGFTFKTGGAWNKKRWGTGYVMRSVTEPFLIATAGEPKIRGQGVPNLIEESRRDHSRKPEACYRFAREMVGPSPKAIELFSRTRRAGWDVWGDEIEKFQPQTNLVPA